MTKFWTRIKISFFVFLDISGILLGVFLILLGLWTSNGKEIPTWLGWVIFVIGIGAFLLHIGHYYNLPYVKWFFGPDYFIRKDKN